MGSVRPSYLIVLVVVILFVVYLKVSNPYREYSTSKYWQSATVESVRDIPDEALKEGNKNGPVLMWAAIGATDPKILYALVERGSSINESDGIFKGTPLTGAAGYSKSPEIISALIKLGAEVDKTVHGGETALMVAARYNSSKGIVSKLIFHGANAQIKNASGQTALDIAKKVKNDIAIRELNGT